MKQKIVPIVLCGLLASLDAFAQTPACSPSQQLSASEIQTLVGGKTMCANTSTEKWQEFHSGSNGGSLVDYKKGPSDPVDPTAPVGSWSTTPSESGDARLIHTYGSASYSWKVFDNCNGSYSLTGPNGGGTSYIFTLQSGQSGCP